MDVDDSTGTSGPLKRQREPFSDIEENVPISDGKDEQKRRRLESSSQENWSPKPSSLGRSLELEVKPDTPALPSVRQLIQRREGMPPLAQRFLSDPGYQVTSFALLTGREELQATGSHQSIPRPSYTPRNRSSLQEDCKAGTNQVNDGSFTEVAVPAQSPKDGSLDHTGREELQATGSHQSVPRPSNSCPRNRSSLVIDMHQKLQSSVTPSSKQASRIRQEREEELRLLRSQPISDNAWLKRSYSDSSLAKVGTSHSTPSFSWLVGRGKMHLWPPLQPSDEDCKAGTSHVNDGSFTAVAVPTQSPDGVEDGSLDNTGEGRTSSAQMIHASVPEAVLVETDTSPIHQRGAAETESLVEVKATTAGEIQGEVDACSEAEQKEAEPVTSDTDHGDLVLHATEQAGETPSSEEQAGETPSSEEQAGETPSSEEQSGETPNSEEQAGETPSSEEQAGATPSSEEQAGETPSSEEQAGETPSSEEQAGETPSSEEQAGETLSSEEQPGETPNSEEQAGETLSSEEQPGETPNSEEQAGETPSSEEQEDMIKEQTGEAPSSEEQEDMLEERAGETPSSQEQDEETGEAPREEEQIAEVQSVSSSLKKVGFVLEPELINDSAVQSEPDSSYDSSREDAMSDFSSHDETNTAEMIDQMFEEVLEMATGGCQEDHDSGIAAGSTEKDVREPLPDEEEEEGEEGEEEEEEEEEERRDVDTSGDDLTFPPSGILSPLGKSVEAVVTPMRLAASQLSNPASLLLTPKEQTTPPPDTAPLYSIDAYRTQSQSTKPDIVIVTPGVQRQNPDKTQTKPSINTKERILALNEEAGKLQTVISQTLQALGCCTDEVHGRGSLEEAEAEKLLLVSCEKRTALLAEVARLKESSSEVPRAGGGDVDSITQVPCRGTVSISSVQLPLKVEFVCSARNRTGRPSHFFFVLIRYGACDIVATPLATAANAMNGDTISFSTSITLKDIRSNFEIDVEVYSLSHTSGNACPVERSTAKSRVTPRKLLNTFSKSNHSGPSSGLPARSARRSSNFSLVGSHKITLDSLGQNKFPLDKMKFEGKIRKLLGDEFQEKVPFLSPLEGSIYLRLDSEGHSNVQHQGFLTMFEVVNEFGAWHRRFFVLKGGHMFYWNHPNDQGSKVAEGSISLSSSSSQSVKPVNRDSCARPFTFELVSNIQTQQQDGHRSLAKCWFCADTRQERDEWMNKLNQVLLDIHTWSHTNRQAKNPASSSEKMRESIL
ncbi:anillin, actin binding protein 2 isoform X2 [Osmerus eperlanus]|uniref:anillin, actin binding protein 2 isoform X2 n=1 Tax=Osmerus eperlanus TaxID=29151 RepID=UPI002E1378BA